MASAAQSLRLVCRSCRSRRPTTHPLGAKVFVAWKSASGGGGNVKESQDNLDDGVKSGPFDHWEAEDKARHEKYREMAPSNIARSVFSEDFEDLDRRDFGKVDWRQGIDDVRVGENVDELHELVRPYNKLVKPLKTAFWDEDETDPDLISGDDGEEFNEDDMTDIAHAKLEEHREQREYARIAVWEMPLLASKCDTGHRTL